MKKISYILLSILLCFSLYLIFNYKKRVNSLNTSIREREHEHLILKEHTSNLITKIYRNDAFLLDKNIEIEGVDGKMLPLSSLILKKGKILIFRHNESGCSLCVEQEFIILKEFAKKFRISNLVVLTTMKGMRRLTVYNQQHNVDFRIFSVKYLGLPQEKESMDSFVFLLGKDMMASHFFLPDYKFPYLSRIYYSTVMPEIVL